MPNATQNQPPVGTSKTYLKATLKDGTNIVASFEKLANVQKYAATIFARMNCFNAWELVARVHPTSGEPCLVRRRRMISGDQITEIERVVARTLDSINAIARRTGEAPMTAESYANAVASYDPNMFESALEIQHGEGGLWVAPLENTPENAVAGERYPIHINAQTLARYVILKAATATTPEVTFQIEANRAVSTATIDELTGAATAEEGPIDGDEDIDEDELERER